MEGKEKSEGRSPDMRDVIPKVGIRVDLLDTENIWCPATVVKVIGSFKDLKVLLRYDGWGRDYDEELVSGGGLPFLD